MVSLMMCIMMCLPWLILKNDKFYFMVLPLLTMFISMFIYPSFQEIEGMFSALSWWSILFVILTGIVFLGSSSILSHTNWSGVVLTLLLFFSLVLFFVTDNILIFYISFESATLFMFLLIYWEGKSFERLEAALSLFVYMVFFSLPLLYVVFVLINENQSLSMILMSNTIESSNPSWILFLGSLGFLVKGPVMGVHVWLTKAHVHGSLFTSVILAGILLKMSIFGLIKLKMLSEWQMLNMNIFLSLFVLWGSIISVGMTLKQVDSKSFVAYSSIGVMGLALTGVLMDHSESLMSTLLIMMGHGFSSPILFILVYVFYFVQGTRSLLFQAGGILGILSVKYLTFFACCLNIPVPFTLSFLGEILLIKSVSTEMIMLLMVLIIVFLGSCYNMYLYYMLTSFKNPLMGKSSELKMDYLLSISIFLFAYLLVFKSSLFLMMSDCSF